MKIGRIIHQQVMQLRWQSLACFGLVMVLPLEEAIVSWYEGDGFYSAPMAVLSTMFSPLLAGLIACAAVQADLDERRDIFWRSKPVRVGVFITLKYVVGLVIALLILGYPVVFGLLGDVYYPRSNDIVAAAKPIFLNILFISMMTYSVCFLCNVLIRKTARAWLAGMAIAILLLLVPFILPLNLKDFTTEFLNVISVIYVSITLGAFVLAFMLSLVAVAYNWHLRTNLKGLLWSTTAVMFGLILLFTHQVANIQVLDELTQVPDKTDPGQLFTGFLDSADGQIISPNFTGISVDNNQITMVPMSTPLPETLKQQLAAEREFYQSHSDLTHSMYPGGYPFSFAIKDRVYGFSLDMFYRERKIGDRTVREYEKLYLRLFRFENGLFIQTSILDLSDLLVVERGYPIFQTPQIDDKLIVFVNRSYAVVRIKDDDELALIDKKVNKLNRYRMPDFSKDKEVMIPLVLIEHISAEDRIRLSIDRACLTRHAENRSKVDIHEGAIRFALLTDDDIFCYEVKRWDEESIYCRFRDARPFTFLERLFNPIGSYDDYFVKGGKLYAYSETKLMVFDIRSEQIRKLGHFERISENFHITDLEVLDDGKMLMSTVNGYRNMSNEERYLMGSLFLLENPE